LSIIGQRRGVVVVGFTTTYAIVRSTGFLYLLPPFGEVIINS